MFRWSWLAKGGFRSTQVGFKLPWAGVGPLVLVGGHGFARHEQPRVLGLVIVAKNGSNLVFFFLIIIWVCGYGFGNGGC